MDKKNSMCSVVQKQLSVTKEYLNTLNIQISYSNDLLSWFKGLCTHLTKLLVNLTDLHKNVSKTLEYKETLLLYLEQVLAILSLHINLFVRETEVDVPLTQIRNFCKKQMMWSLEGIEETLTNETYLQVYKSNFINWMDSALDKIGEIDFDSKKDAEMGFNEANKYFEEVLSHAMSIAQVVLEDDYKMIRGSSQSVLDALASLSTELNKPHPNTAMLNLFVEICSTKLCALERKVNTAVLRLSLKVFSEYTVPLEAIHNFCFDTTKRGKQDELDDLVVEFDLHVDRILQIGLFAISCSSSTNNCTKLRSCLASLEALETELVPAFSSVLLDLDLNNIQLALLLKDHWVNQAKVLQNLIFLVIEPSAFCKVIFEENKELMEKLSHTFRDESRIDTICFNKLIRQSKVLDDFATVVLKEEKENCVHGINAALTAFKCVLHEVEAAHDILSQEKKSCFRIWKRCKILLTSTKTLWNCFLNENSENQNPYYVKELSDRRQSPVEFNSKNGFGNAFLDHIVARGQQILKERSILYKTALQNNTFKVPEESPRARNESYHQIPSLKLAHIRNRTFINSNKTSNELQMTDILNELNNLSFASVVGVKEAQIKNK